MKKRRRRRREKLHVCFTCNCYLTNEEGLDVLKTLLHRNHERQAVFLHAPRRRPFLFLRTPRRRRRRVLCSSAAGAVVDRHRRRGRRSDLVHRSPNPCRFLFQFSVQETERQKWAKQEAHRWFEFGQLWIRMGLLGLTRWWLCVCLCRAWQLNIRATCWFTSHKMPTLTFLVIYFLIQICRQSIGQKKREREGIMRHLSRWQYFLFGHGSL